MPCRRLIAAAAITLVAAAAAHPQAEDGSLIQLSLDFGFGVPNEAVWLYDPLSGIPLGLASEDLVRRIFIRREMTERIFLDFDYDSQRSGGFLGEDNVYSILYTGMEGDFLRELSAGNRYLSIEGSPLVPIDRANASSYALRALATAGRFDLQAMLRYSQDLPGRRVFRGNRRVIETALPETSYARWRFFLLPDRGIDQASLEVLRTADGAGERIVDGKSFDRLLRGVDFDLDDVRGWLALRRSLTDEEELLVFYTKGGQLVGSGPLGQDAIIDPSGSREDFSSAAYGDYFDAGSTWLYLKRDLEAAVPAGFRGYWENRGAYLLGDLSAGELAERVTVQLELTATGAPNQAYDSLIQSFVVDPAAGALVFTFTDAVGFYPRPFPGAEPYPIENPFDPDNLIYGGLEGPPPTASVNTIVARYEVSSDSFFLDYDIVEGSVTVLVNGTTVSASAYWVDYDSGVITFRPGAVGPGSEIEVRYRYSPVAGGDRELLAAFGSGYELGPIRLHNLLSFRYPLAEGPSLELGEERPFQLADSLDLRLAFGPAEEDGLSGAYAELDAGGSLALSRASSRRRAVVAEMSAADEEGSAALGMANDSPASLSVQVATAQHTGDGTVDDPDLFDPEVAADPLSAAYPEAYEELHGRPSFRASQGHVESTLVVSFAPPLAEGERATVSRRFGYPADLSSYRELRLYLFLPAGQSIPADASMVVSLRSSSQDRLEILIPPASFRERWNEILLELEAPWAVRLNGAAAGVLEVPPPGTLTAADLLRRVGEIRFGVHAEADITADSVEFWVDEWHLAGSRWSFDAAGYGRARAGYRGDLGALAGMPLVSDPALEGAWEHRQGSLLEVGQGSRDSWSAAVQARTLGVLGLEAETGGTRESPGGGAAQGLLGGFEEGGGNDRWSHRFALELPWAFLPALEHSYEHSASERRSLSIREGETRLDTERVTRETLAVGERLVFPAEEAEEGVRVLQEYAYSRSFREDSLASVDAVTGLPAGTSLSASLSQTHAGELSFLWGDNEAALRLRRDEGFEDPTPEPAAPAGQSYGDRLASLFSPPGTALPGAQRVLRTDRGALALEVPLRRYLGASLGLEQSYGELNADPATGRRDVSTSAAWNAALPWSPGGQGLVRLTPRLRQSFSGSWAGTAAGLQETEFLLNGLGRALVPPLWYLSPNLEAGRLREYQAVDLLAASALVQGSSSARLDSALSVELALRDPPVYLPGRLRAAIEGQTTRQGAGYGQKRSYALSAGRTLSKFYRSRKIEFDTDVALLCRFGAQFPVGLIPDIPFPEQSIH